MPTPTNKKAAGVGPAPAPGEAVVTSASKATPASPAAAGSAAARPKKASPFEAMRNVARPTPVRTGGAGSVNGGARAEGSVGTPDRLAPLENSTSSRKLPGALLLPLSMLEASVHQVRREFNEENLGELAEDIRVRGILEPLVVREIEPGRYEIVAGERRYRAARLAGLAEVPVILHQLDDQEMLFAMMAENLQREDLTPLEEKQAFLTLQAQYNFSIEDLARLIKKSRTYVSKRLNLSEEASSSSPQTAGSDGDKNHEVTQGVILSKNSQSERSGESRTGGRRPAIRRLPQFKNAYRRFSVALDSTLEAFEAERLDAEAQAELEEALGRMGEKIEELKLKLAKGGPASRRSRR